MPERPWILFDIGGVLELVDDDTWPQQWWDRWRRHAGLSAEEFEARLAVADLPPIDIETGTGSASGVPSDGCWASTLTTSP